MKKLFILILTILGAFVLYKTIIAQDMGQIMQSLRAFGLGAFFLFFILSCFNFGLYAWRWKLITESLQNNIHISFWRFYLHRMAGYSVSYMTPSAQVGGEPVRIAFLIRDGIKKEHATASVTIDLALELFFLVGFIFLGSLFALFQNVLPASIGGIGFLFLIFFLGLFLAMWILIRKGYRPFARLLARKQKKTHGFYTFLANTETVIADFFTKQQKETWRIALLSMGTMIFRMVEVYMIAWGFGMIHLSFNQIFLSATLPGLALLIPIPAGIGVFEGGIGTIFALLSIPISAFAFAMIIRARDLLFILIGFIHIFCVSRGFLKDKKV